MNQFLKNNFGFILVIALGLIPLFPLLHSGLPITHDGQDHVARIANFYASLSEGNVIPRWAANLNWGYGHPILMFLYPFPSYFASLVHVLGFSFVDSVKIVFGLSFILSGVFMFLWIRNLCGEKCGIVAAVLYMYAPYRFVDLYVRGAIGEHAAFIFVPLVFYSLYKIANSKTNSLFPVLLSLSVAGLILSHNAISIMFLPLIIIYAAIHIYYARKRMLLGVTYATFLGIGLGLSSFFLFPAFLEGKYTLRDIVTGSGEYRDRFVSLTDYINLGWSFGGTDLLSKQIGIVQLAGMLLAFFYIRHAKGVIKSTAIIFFVLLFCTLFIMLEVSDFVWRLITTLQKFQFPWRFLSVVVFLSAFLASLPAHYIKNKRNLNIFCVGMCALAVLLYAPYYTQVNGYLTKSEEFFTSTYNGTTDTGESAPIWSVRFMEKQAVAPVEVVEGKGKIQYISKGTDYKSYTVAVETHGARIRENTLYFPNWKVYVNGVESQIEFQDPSSRGLITYNLPEGKNRVDVRFEDTKLRIVSNAMSGASVFLLVIYSSVIVLKKWKR